MAWFLGQSLLYVALAFLLGLLVGWLTWGQTTKPTTHEHNGVADGPEPVAAVIVAPVAEANPEGVADAEPTIEPEPAVELVAVADAEPEPATQPEPVIEPVAVADTEPEPATQPEPVIEPAAVADTEPEPAPEPEPALEPVAAIEPVTVTDTEPEPATEPEPVIEPVAVADTEPEPTLEPVPVADVEPESIVEPALIPAPTDKPDNLQRIEGIGPKISMVLVAAGFRTYEQLANSDEATLAGALRNGGLRLAPSLSTWSAQAALLAKGDEAGFAALAAELVASRRAR